MQILESNKIALQKRMPRLWDALFALSEGIMKNSCFQIAEAKDGSLIDIMHTENGDVYLQSQYRPVEEAKRFVKQYVDAKPDSCFLFLGMGNGYVLREFINRQDVAYVCYEPSLSYFYHVLCHYDLHDVILHPSVHLYVNELNDRDMKLDMYRYVNQLNWHLFYLEAMPKYRQLYPEELEFLSILYRDSQIHGKQNYDAVISKGETQFENMLMNLEYIYEGSCIHEYKNILNNNMPVIVVAAGPSLEKNIDCLKQCRDKAFIIAVDRVAPMLAKHGIIPHAYVTVDSEKELELFQDEQSKDVPWFVYTTSKHAGLKLLGNPKIIFASTICQYAKTLFRLINSDIDELINGGSVATVAVAIALELGSKNVILIGQDLALTDDKAHAGEEKGAELAWEKYLLSVKGYYGESVTTRTDFKAYLDWYEAFVANRKDVTFVNATEGGAYIEGMEHISLKEAMEKYGLDSMDGMDLLLRVPWLMTSEKQQIILIEYKRLAEYFEMVKKEVEIAIRWMQRGIDILEHGTYQNPKLEQVEKHMNAFQSLYNGHDGHFILELLLGKEIQDGLLDLHFTEDNLNEELKRLYTKMLMFYEGVKVAVEKAIPILNEVLTKLEAKEQ